MDDSAEVMSNEEHYKVIDECMEEEETPIVTQNSEHWIQEGTISYLKSEDDVTPNNENLDKTEMKVDHNLKIEDRNNVKLNNDAIDVALELDIQKDITDEDVMHHLDVIENIELDPETFGIQSTEKNTEFEFSTQEKEQNQDVTIMDELVQMKWYEKKIAEKNALLRERLSKLARVLTVSYPSYEKWLERIEKIEGSPICKLDPIRHCSLDKPHTNRWKFICSKKQIQEFMKEEDSSDTSSKKNFRTAWHLKPMAAGGVNTNNLAEFPHFVLNAVKIFEDFLQTTISQDTSNENSSDESDLKKNASQDTKQQWLWLLVRSNSMDELMLFATGKNISRSTMDRLKQTFESGPGKNCNVKSLYCKSINKCSDKVVTTFLVGAEALDEIVGTLKVQLAPKTNFWSNTAGALNVAKTVFDMLKPTPKTTVLEIGCGIGVVGLMMASKCREVIGVDSPSEVEEAEMTTELNNIYNASFIVGSSTEVVNKLNSARDLHNKNRITFSIINANTNMGRAIEVMTCLRKITSLRRIVMVTTLTKQSVRAILELARPIESGLGHPFMPIRACVVDTLPTGPHFEAVIVMERRLMHRLSQPWFIKMLEEESKSLDNTRELEKIIKSDTIESTDVQKIRKNPMKTALEKNPKLTRKPSPAKSGSTLSEKLKLKREHPDTSEIPKKMIKRSEKSGSTSWQDIAVKKKNWFHDNSALHINPLFDKKIRENKEKIDLREKLSNNRVDADLIQKVNESREILEAAKEKLSGPSPSVDPTTAKELKNVLSLVLDQTNKFQNQLPRSVWDRISPPKTDQKVQIKKELDNDPLLKGRFVQETQAQAIVITTANKEYLENNEEIKPKFKKYHNLAPLEPNTTHPVSLKYKIEKMEQKLSDNRNRQQNQDNSWNRNKNFEKNRWNDTGVMRKLASPAKRQNAPFRYRVLPPRRFSPKRPLLSPPRHPCSPPRRHFSPNRLHQMHGSSYDNYSPQRRSMSPLRHVISPSNSRRQAMLPRRPFSPFREKSSLRRPASSPRRLMPTLNRSISPMGSSSRRQISPIGMRYNSSQMSSKKMSPTRRSISPMNREYQNISTWRSKSPIGRMISPPRSRDMIPRNQSPMRCYSPRCQSPPNRTADEWDIPSRGAIEQSSVWQRSINEKPAENVWRNERQPTTSGNWQLSSNNDRYHKPINQEKSWDVRDSSSHGNSWSTKQSSVRLGIKEPWQNSDNRWSASRSGTSGENWNRGKESLGGHRESWMDMDKSRWEQMQLNDGWNQCDKDDWNDLPEDARDPWGDESNLGLKERWTNFDNQTSSWFREPDKGDSWTKSKDSWQNKPQSFPAKQLCQSNNPNDSRWLPINDMNTKIPSSNWQGSSNTGLWQSSNYNFQSQSQRLFTTNMFKDRR